MSNQLLGALRLKGPPSLFYIGLVFALSRLCFWVMAYFNNMTPIEGLCRWDCHWYLHISLNGYDLAPHGSLGDGQANWAFFPLFPAFIWVVTSITSVPAPIVSILLSNLFIFFAIVVSLKYIKNTRAVVDEHFWIWLCSFGPFSFYFTSGYSESLFWLLACAGLLLWQKQKYFKAGLVGVCLSATRLFGICWPAAWFVEILLLGGLKTFLNFRTRPTQLFAICLAPLGLFAFIAFLFFHMGDGLAFFHVQQGWGRSAATSFLNTATSLSVWTDFTALFNEVPGDRFSFAYLNFFGLLGVGLTGWLIRSKRIIEASIAIMIMFIAFKAGFLSLPRFIVGVPVFAMAFHDAACHFFPKQTRLLALIPLVIFNFWLLSNWFENAYFLV